ncbi:ATP-dependent DNA helicase DinG [Colwellia sp. 75C3]|uniref:ATP-dependent DNA helicase DinG n=1 Tax=Colwellia sp. 75C3 TaxID=888425 RepID=UPI000C32EA60|nr:ATP-dependent DNA helicase DinG [Colwellia sp. 75C3]PKG81759.1 ATP-dependent DNA helicase DinG [Colwellia sp. 75C3]
MLSDKLKQAIRQAYKAIGENLTHFNPRKQQTLLIAEIAKTLAGEYDKDRKIITIEAGTGTGKSLAYCLGAIPLALSRDKKVCISTATVALQEQLVDKDLPFLKKYAGLNFDFTLVKGRQRYVCRQKLTQAVTTGSGSEPAQVGFTFAEKPDAKDVRTLNSMHKALLDGSWLGDIDSWETHLPHHIWQQVQSDKHSCLKNLSEHTHCPFHKARETMDQAHVLVINHSLLLADLELGGGRILSSPEDTIYIIDEAHHLPKVARDFSSASITLKGSIDWLTKLRETGDKMAKLIKSRNAISPALKLGDDCQDLLLEMQKVLKFVEANANVYFLEEESTQGSTFAKKSQSDSQVYRFENGVIPPTLKNWAEDLQSLSKKSLTNLTKLYSGLIEAVKDGDTQMYLAEPLLAEAGFMIQRLENLQSLWFMYAKTDSDKGAPMARWLERVTSKRLDYLLSASPIEVGFTLENMLWSQCEGAVLCSATLRALNSFDHFRFQVGLKNNDGSQYQQVDSPFDYQNNAQLVIANMDNEASAPAFTDEVITKLPRYLAQGSASLVLFSSYWQMNKVAEALRDNSNIEIMVQGELSRQKIIEQHKKRCDDNKVSIIFGTQSFSEGLDLPGAYLNNLIITKLPFSVPTSPVEQAQAEYVTAKGGNPFMTLSVPDTSKKLVQACGRLLRNEMDEGVITLLDKRVVTKRYGKQLLDSLPPFRRVFEK